MHCRLRNSFSLERWLLAGMLLATSTSAAWPATARAQAQTHMHEVQPGETIQDIAQANGLSPSTIMAANDLPNPDLLRVGQDLVIPPQDGVLHTVTDGETLGGIADHFGVTTSDLVSANALDSADALAIGAVLLVPGANLAAQATQASASQAAATQAAGTATPPSPPQATTYTVKDGDTLRSIADTFKLDILSLVAMNNIDNPDVIRPGSQLLVSAKPAEYVVQPGDTLGNIAWQNSVDSDALLRVNGLEDPDRIVTGMTLVLPMGGATAHAQPASSPAAPASSSAGGSSSAPAARSAAPATQPAAPARTQAPAPAPAPAAAAPAPSNHITAMVTGYAIGAGAVSSHTASGTTTHWGTVAADTHLFPFGTRVRIEGLGDTVFVVEDTGSAVRGNVFDVWCPDAATARQLGARTRQVTILAPGES